MCQAVVRYEPMTLGFHSSYSYFYSYWIYKVFIGKLDLCLDLDKDYWTMVYELYSDCHGQVTGHIGKLQMYILCCHPSRSLQILWIIGHCILCLSGTNRYQVSYGKVMFHMLVNFSVR